MPALLSPDADAVISPNLAAWDPSRETASMAKTKALDPAVRERLIAYHQQMIWLSRQPFVTPGMARAWFTHIAVERVRRNVRMYTGKVSVKAAKDPTAILRLEHQKRIQMTITELVRRQMKLKRPRSKEFIDTVLRCEQVHIVTFDENYAAMKAHGNYRKAGIKLVRWNSLPKKSRELLWKKMLRGKVANAAKFNPRLA